MATQLKPTDYQPIPIPIPAARPRVRVAFSQPATGAMARALGEMPVTTREATLEAITIGADAEALIATAKHVLSPHMYDAFLQWGEAVARALDSRNDDDAQDKASDRQTETVRAIYNLIPVSFEDFGFKTWIAGVDAGDCSCLGPLRPRDGYGTGIRDAVASIADDLARTSTMARELDRFACRAQFLAGTAFNLPAAIADAIATSFVTAQNVFADLPVAETFVRRDVEAIPTPFYRGLLLEWDKAYAAYQQAAADTAAATGESDPDNLTGEAESYAYHRLLLLPAPSPAALAVKARLYEHVAGWQLRDAGNFARVFTSDARRFAKLGAFPQTDTPLLAAFEEYRLANVGHHALPMTATTAEENVFYDRMDAPMETLLTTRATTVEGVIAKLLYGFKAVGNDAWMDEVMLAPNSPRFREGLEMSGMYERTLWGAIEDLARIAGVSLTEKAA